MPKFADSENDQISLQHLLNDWPYAREYLLETLDGVLIERHAAMHLSRALNTGAAVAFMGAGVSMAYGRISWKNLVTELQRDALAALQELEPDEAKQRTELPRLYTLRKNLENLKFDERPPGGDLSSDRYPTVFQLCAELSQGVAKEKENRAHREGEQTDKDDLFDAGVKQRTRDGHFHSIHLLTQYLTPKALRQDLLQRFNEKVYATRTISRKEMFRLIDLTEWLTSKSLGKYKLSDDHQELQDIIKNFFKNELNIDGYMLPLQLKPSLRFLVSAACCNSGADWSEKIAKLVTNYLEYGRHERLAGSLRSSGTQGSTDVIDTLRTKLQIRRFMTTNYDLEAERMIYDLDFHPGTTERGITRSTDPLHRIARDFVVIREAPASLVDFATREGGFVLDVAHLHGRALPGEHIVAAETQYQDFYLRDDGHRDLLDQAIKLAFRSNLLLFIGNGMGEDDILRPLRHFMSEDRGPTQPPAVALLPDLWGDEFVLEEKVSLLRRYGVYTIHWGYGRLSGWSTRGPLLRKIKTLIKTIKGILATIETAEKVAEKAEAFSRAKDADNARAKNAARSQPSWKADRDAEVAERSAKNAAALAKDARKVADDQSKTSFADRKRRVEKALSDWDKMFDDSKSGSLVFQDIYGARCLHDLVEIEGDRAAPGARAPKVIWLEWQALAFIVRVADEVVRGPQRPDGTREDGLRKWSENASSSTRDESALTDRLRQETNHAAAARVIAAEIEDAILSAVLAAKVDQLGEDWRDWQKNWIPSNFDVRATSTVFSKPEQQPSSCHVSQEFKSDRRHALVLVEQDTSSPTGRPSRLRDRTFRARYSQTYAEFLDALQQTISSPNKVTDQEGAAISWSGRRVYFLGGARGLGKGHLFSALTNTESFADYANVVAKSTDERVPFFALHGSNLSFSVEIGSAFGRLCEFIFQCIKEMYAAESDQSEFIKDLDYAYGLFVSTGTRTTGDRVGALRFLLGILAGKGFASDGQRRLPQPKMRIAVIINAAHLMFNSRGFAKSAEIQRSVTALLDKEFSNARIDIFFIGNEARMPAEIRHPALSKARDLGSRALRTHAVSSPKPRLGDEEPPPKLWVSPVEPIARTAFDEAEDNAMIDALRLRIATGKVDAKAATTGMFFHRVQQPRISVVMLTAFPRVAMALARAELMRPGLGFPTSVTDELKKDARLKLKDIDERCSEFFNSHPPPEQRATGVYRIERPEVAEWFVDEWLSGLTVDDEIKKKAAKEVDRRFGRLYKDLGRSRLCVSIVCAAADEAIARQLVEERSGPMVLRPFYRVRDRPSGEALAAAERVVDNLSKALGGSDEAHREDTVIRAVIDHYRSEMDAGWLGENAHWDEVALKKAVRQGAGKSVDNPDGRGVIHPPAVQNFRTLVGSPRELGRILFQLDEEVLTALAMIGHPVEADCLAALHFRAFEILEQRVWGTSGPAERHDPDAIDRVRIKVTELSLERLVRRCLVFRFVGRARDDQGQERFRFGVHRLVQRHVFRRMQQPRVEFPEVSNFMPTLYADQPNDLPYPSIRYRESIRDMMVRLSLYPSRSRLSRSGRLPKISPERAARMLRAAYGVGRSVLSLAVVTRFDSLVPDIKPPAHGFIEEHRHTIRWLTRRAVGLEKTLAAERDRTIQAERKHTDAELAKAEAKDRENEIKARLRDAELKIDQTYRYKLPFFIDDHIWLHNECGVLSLAQGRLLDAAKLFSTAQRAAQRIEAPNVGGAQTSIIRVNRAIVDIELGKCSKADEVLRAIAETPDENRSVRWIAHGYRGLVAHITGDAAAALRRYMEASEALRAMNRSRAASIFNRHLADLLRREGKHKEAREAAETAVNLAAKGNHADVGHLARLSRLRVDLETRSIGADAAMLGLSDFQKTLTNVTSYARIIGMPRIAVEAAHLDAAIRFKVGDLHYANISVMEALALANENGMTLKKVALTILAAKIYLERGLPDDARLLAASARDVAIATQYAAVKDEAQNVLVRCDAENRRG